MAHETLRFEEAEHKYFIDYQDGRPSKEIPSVTQIIDSFGFIPQESKDEWYAERGRRWEPGLTSAALPRRA